MGFFDRFTDGFGRLIRGEVTQQDFNRAIDLTRQDIANTSRVLGLVPELVGTGAGLAGAIPTSAARGALTGGASDDLGILPQTRQIVQETRRIVTPTILDATGTVADVAGGAVQQAGGLSVTVLGTAGETIGKGAGALTKGFFTSPAGIATLAGGGILAYALLRR